MAEIKALTARFLYTDAEGNRKGYLLMPDSRELGFILTNENQKSMEWFFERLTGRDPGAHGYKNLLLEVLYA